MVPAVPLWPLGSHAWSSQNPVRAGATQDRPKAGDEDLGEAFSTGVDFWTAPAEL